MKNSKSKNVIQNVNIRIGDTNKKKTKRRRKRTTKQSNKQLQQAKPPMSNFQYPAPIIVSQPQAPAAPNNTTTIIQPPAQPQQDNLLLMNSFVDKLSKSQNDFQVANFNNFKNDINNTITNNNNLLSNYVNQGNYGLATGILNSNNYIINNTNEKFNEFGNKINNLQEKLNNNTYFNHPKVEEIKTPEPIKQSDDDKLAYVKNPLLSNTKKLINKFEYMNNDYKTSKIDTSNNDYATPKLENIYKDNDYSTTLLFGGDTEEPPDEPVKQPEPIPIPAEPEEQEIIKQPEPKPEPEPVKTVVFKWKCPLCEYGNNADIPSNLNTHLRLQHTSKNNLDGTKPFMNKKTGISGVYITKPEDYIDNLINQNNNEGKQRQTNYYASKRKT
jgi:hypothetical protein